MSFEHQFEENFGIVPEQVQVDGFSAAPHLF